MAVTFRETRLDNGLVIIGEVDPEAHTSAAGFFVNTGTRDEEEEVMGVSHFLEHMMFKGTQRRSADDVNREFDELGANYNAFTSQEMTAFWAHVLPEHLPAATDLLADILRPALRPEDFETERGVILEEIAMYEDQPFWRLYETAMARYYADHPLGYRVLGTKDSIGGLERDRMVDYFTRRYAADNTVLALAGRLDFEAMVDRVEQACRTWESTGTTRAYPPVDRHAVDFTIRDERANRHYMLLVTPGPAVQDERRYAARMLADAIGAPEGSLLYWSLVETGLAEEAQAGYDPRDRVGEYFLFASCPPDRAEQVLAVIDDTIRAAVDSLTEDDLARHRNRLATSRVLQGERPAGRMQRLGRSWTQLGMHLPMDEELARIEAVTLDDLRAVHDAFPFSPRTVAHLAPAGSAVKA